MSEKVYSICDKDVEEIMKQYILLVGIVALLVWCGTILVDNYYYRPQERLQDYLIGYLYGSHAQKDVMTNHYSIAEIFKRIAQDTQKFLTENVER